MSATEPTEEQVERIAWKLYCVRYPMMEKYGYNLKGKHHDNYRKEARYVLSLILPMKKAGNELRKMADPTQNMSDIPLKDAMTRWDYTLAALEKEGVIP